MRSRGPGAPWLEDEGEDTVYPLVLRRTADALADRLAARVARLRSDDVATDEVLMEIRKQMAACALDDPILAADLADLMIELVWTKENALRAI